MTAQTARTTCVVDTHALLWVIAGSTLLSLRVKELLRGAGTAAVIPAIVLAEVAHLHWRGRATVSVERVLSYVRSAARTVVVPVDAEVVRRMPPGLEIHDAIIVATAVLLRDQGHTNVVIATRDAAIKECGAVPVVW
jgi:predicted nucleic acid-binding protein